MCGRYTLSGATAMRAAVLLVGMLALLLTSCARDSGDPRGGKTPSPGGPAVLPARVARVIDGDTLEVRLAAGERERVRLIGIDTPEDTREHEYFGPEATAATARRAGGRDVWLERDVEERDRYGRLLAYVWLEIPRQGDEPEARGRMLNAALLAEGLAQLMTVPPNVKYVDLFVKLQREARDGNRGMWHR